jgi:hypothetical protein
MDIIKKESYHSLHMWNEWNGAVSVHGNKIVNMPVLVLYNGVWLSQKMIKHHLLDIFHSHGLFDL